MPSKNKRAAIRQASLNQRRKRRSSRAQNANSPHSTTPTKEIRRAPGGAENVQTQAASTAAPSAPTIAPTAMPTAARRRTSRAGRLQLEPLTMYPYLAPELKRIGAITGAIALILTALTFVLG